MGWCSSTRTASARSRRWANASNPRRADHLPWNELEGVDAVYFTAGDVGALREARQAHVLVATSRIADLLAEADVHLDAVVGSAADPAEAFDPDAARRSTGPGRADRGRRGGRYETDDGRSGRYEAVAPPGPVVDTYGAGDSFAAGLTFALGRGWRSSRRSSLAARCGAWCVAGRGPYGNQLTASDLER